MSFDHRARLVRIARRFDALIITDDVYDFLQWPSSSASSGTHAQFPNQAYVPRTVDLDRCDYPEFPYTMQLTLCQVSRWWSC